MSAPIILAFALEGVCLVPEGTVALAGVRNQFQLPSGQILSIQAVVEVASGPDADDHHDLGFAEADALGITLELRERTVEISDEERI